MKPAELERIHDQHADSMFHLAMSLLRDPAAARDVMQDVFLKLGRSGPDPAPLLDERAYILRSVRHAAIDRLRRRKVRLDHASRENPELLQPCADPDREAFRLRLEEALAHLPHEQREIVVLKLWEGHTFEAIARICGIPPNTAASRYRYALEKLRNLLRPIYEEL